VGQAVDEVDTDGLEAALACFIHHREGFFLGLDAVDGLLHPLVEILDAQAHAVETQLAEQGHGGPIHLARVHFDGNLGPVHQLEVAVGEVH